jgi:hypothetical protein
MKRLFLTAILVTACVSQAADTAPRVTRAILAPAEKSLDERIERLWEDNPLALLGSTRGVYLDGYGAVFTAEVNTVIGGTTLMHLTLSKEDKDRHRKKKLERLPQLRTALKQALVNAAAALDPVNPDDQVVIAVFLSRYPWEDASGMPVQMTLQAQKKKLLEVQRAGGAGIDQAIQFREF